MRACRISSMPRSRSGASSMTETQVESQRTIDLEAIEFELRPLGTEKLKFRFHECRASGARLLAEAAICVKLLKERGEDMQGLQMIGTFLRIAAGQLSPELVWRFLESRNRQLVESLPLPDQEKLAADPMIP